MQALTGDHGDAVAAFAVMLVEAGLLSVRGIERQWFAETCSEGAAESSGDVLAAAHKTPSTAAARRAWCVAHLVTVYQTFCALPTDMPRSHNAGCACAQSCTVQATLP